MKRTDEIRARLEESDHYPENYYDVRYLLERCKKLEKCLRECAGELDAHYHPMKLEADVLLAEGE